MDFNLLTGSNFSDTNLTNQEAYQHLNVKISRDNIKVIYFFNT